MAQRFAYAVGLGLGVAAAGRAAVTEYLRNKLLENLVAVEVKFADQEGRKLTIKYDHIRNGQTNTIASSVVDSDIVVSAAANVKDWINRALGDAQQKRLLDQREKWDIRELPQVLRAEG